MNGTTRSVLVNSVYSSLVSINVAYARRREIHSKTHLALIREALL